MESAKSMLKMFQGVSSFRRLQTAFLRVSQPGAYASLPILHQPCNTTIFRAHGAAWRTANAGHVSLGQL